jgi:hypothetical protein
VSPDLERDRCGRASEKKHKPAPAGLVASRRFFVPALVSRF